MVKRRLQVVVRGQGVQKKKQREGKPGFAVAWPVVRVMGQKKMVSWVEKLEG